jgi:hypothetical protein
VEDGSKPFTDRIRAHLETRGSRVDVFSVAHSDDSEAVAKLLLTGQYGKIILYGLCDRGAIANRSNYRCTPHAAEAARLSLFWREEAQPVQRNGFSAATKNPKKQPVHTDG